MSSSEQVLRKISGMIVEAAGHVANSNHFKYYDVCSCFNFLWSVYQTDKEIETRTTSSNWGRYQQEPPQWEQYVSGPLPEQEPQNSWYFGEDNTWHNKTGEIW